MEITELTNKYIILNGDENRAVAMSIEDGECCGYKLSDNPEETLVFDRKEDCNDFLPYATRFFDRKLGGNNIANLHVRKVELKKVIQMTPINVE